MEGRERSLEDWKEPWGQQGEGFKIFEGNRRSRLGGEMGGRGVDYVLEKVFNPARNWMRGRRTPDSASSRKFHIGNFDQKIDCGEFSAK